MNISFNLTKLFAASCCVALSVATTVAVEAPQPLTNDSQAYTLFPEALELLATSSLPVDDSGLIGRNKQWGALYSPRFQMGAGVALRIALAAERPAQAARAFRAIEAGTEVIKASGFVPSSLPAHIGGVPSKGNIASAAAFFLGDACLGWIAASNTSWAEKIATSERRMKMRQQLELALGWLLTQQQVLMKVDEFAPNRLLFNARSFQACAQLAEIADTRDAAEVAANQFVEKALTLHSDDGFFIEGAGHDTSYQGVAIRIGEEVLLSGFNDDKQRLSNVLSVASVWLSNRIDSSGRVDSTGNTRTCWSNEQVFGKKKLVSIPDIFMGLTYSAARTGNESVMNAANRVQRWARSQGNVNPCFP